MAKSVERQIREELGQLVRQPDGDSVARDENGTLRATVVYVCDWKKVLKLWPRRNISPHPDFNGMLCDTVEAEREAPGIARITVTYTGVVGSEGGPEGEGEFEVVEELSVSTSQEPIETHPDWATIGTADNGAIFDDDNAFTGWDNGSEYEGITSYLAPGATYSRTYTSTSKPSTLTVGTIVTPTGAPSVGGAYNWLSIGQTFRRQGGGAYTVTEQSRLSGPKGFNSNIY